MYKLETDMFGNVVGVYNMNTSGHIPFDPANTDYQEYLKWVAEGNQPLLADE